MGFVMSPTREWTVLAQDPSVVKRNGRPLLASVRIPAERLLPGPRGHRAQVIDYDPSTETLYRPRPGAAESDPYAGRDLTVGQIESDPHFHSQNVYAIVMATLAQFESALGRNVDWAFASRAPQIKIAPHGLNEANAFYSRDDEALIFGYFPAANGGRSRRNRTIFSCLSHDVVAHETTHAVLDGLKPHYFRPSSPDQAAFHEGFGDLVAILSVFRLSEVVRHVLAPRGGTRTIGSDRVSIEALRDSALLTLAEQMGEEMRSARGEALRESAKLPRREDILDLDEYQLPHRRGEVLVAAMLEAFLTLWHRRLISLHDETGRRPPERYNLERVVEEGSKVAGHLLNIALRALDYAPPIDIVFGDYLSAVLTADAVTCPDDGRYRYREALRESFALFGIRPASNRRDIPGAWRDPEHGDEITYDLTHFEALRNDPIEVFHLLWQNRKALRLNDDAFTVVTGVRPIVRVAPDGFILRETAASYVQLLEMPARRLGSLGITRPAGMPEDTVVRLQGGSALIFDEFGRLRFDIGTGVASRKQTERLQSLWERGYYNRMGREQRSFALTHRARARGTRVLDREGW